MDELVRSSSQPAVVSTRGTGPSLSKSIYPSTCPVDGLLATVVPSSGQSESESGGGAEVRKGASWKEGPCSGNESWGRSFG